MGKMSLRDMKRAITFIGADEGKIDLMELKRAKKETILLALQHNPFKVETKIIDFLWGFYYAACLFKTED